MARRSSYAEVSSKLARVRIAIACQPIVPGLIQRVWHNARHPDLGLART